MTVMMLCAMVTLYVLIAHLPSPWRSRNPIRAPPRRGRRVPSGQPPIRRRRANRSPRDEGANVPDRKVLALIAANGDLIDGVLVIVGLEAELVPVRLVKATRFLECLLGRIRGEVVSRKFGVGAEGG